MTFQLHKRHLNHTYSSIWYFDHLDMKSILHWNAVCCMRSALSLWASFLVLLYSPNYFSTLRIGWALFCFIGGSWWEMCGLGNPWKSNNNNVLFDRSSHSRDSPCQRKHFPTPISLQRRLITVSPKKRSARSKTIQPWRVSIAKIAAPSLRWKIRSTLQLLADHLPVIQVFSLNRRYHRIFGLRWAAGCPSILRQKGPAPKSPKKSRVSSPSVSFVLKS